jgi:hypothetical protein
MSRVDAPKEEKKETEKGRKHTSFRRAPIGNKKANFKKRNFIHLESILRLPKM